MINQNELEAIEATFQEEGFSGVVGFLERKHDLSREDAVARAEELGYKDLSHMSEEEKTDDVVESAPEAEENLEEDGSADSSEEVEAPAGEEAKEAE